MVYRQVQMRSFDAASLRLLEELYESTWFILEARHPFRDRLKDADLQHQLKRKLVILAESSGLNDLEVLQQSALQAFSRGIDF